MAYNLSNHKSGDTFDGVDFTVTVNAAPLDLTGATITMTVKKDSCKGQTVLTLTNGSGLTVTNAANGQFEIDEQIINLPADTYYYEITFTLADTSVKTYISGYWTITAGLEC